MIKFLYYTIILHSNYLYHIYYQASIPIKNLFQKKKITHYITDQTKRSEDLFAITLISIVLPSIFPKKEKKEKDNFRLFPLPHNYSNYSCWITFDSTVLRFILKKKGREEGKRVLSRREPPARKKKNWRGQRHINRCTYARWRNDHGSPFSHTPWRCWSHACPTRTTFALYPSASRAGYQPRLNCFRMFTTACGLCGHSACHSDTFVTP